VHTFFLLKHIFSPGTKITCIHGLGVEGVNSSSEMGVVKVESCKCTNIIKVYTIQYCVPFKVAINKLTMANNVHR